MPARPNTLEVLTMTPSSCSTRRGRKARVPLTTPSKLICRSHSSSPGSESSTDEATATPALLNTAASGGRSGSEPGLVDVGDGDRRAGPRQQPGQAPPDAGGGPGDHRGPSGDGPAVPGHLSSRGSVCLDSGT